MGRPASRTARGRGQPSVEAVDAEIAARLSEVAWAVSRGKPLGWLEFVVDTTAGEREIRALVQAERARRSWGVGCVRPRFRVYRYPLKRRGMPRLVGLGVLVYAHRDLARAWEEAGRIRCSNRFRHTVMGLLLGYRPDLVAGFVRTVRG